MKNTSALAAKIIPCAVVIEVGIQAVYTGVETINAVNENNIENLQKDIEIKNLEINDYADGLSICVCASFCKNKDKNELFITNSTVNKNELITRVAYVNYVNKEYGNDKKYSVDELMDAYTGLLAGDESEKEILDDYDNLLTKASKDFETYEKFSKKVNENGGETEDGREDKLYEAIGKTIREKENEKEKNK